MYVGLSRSTVTGRRVYPVVLSIHDRFRVGKETPIGLAIDRQMRLEPDDARLLYRWVAKRYTHLAFPDALNARLDIGDGRLEGLYRSPEGRVVTGILPDAAADEVVNDAAPDAPLPARPAAASIFPITLT